MKEKEKPVRWTVVTEDIERNSIRCDSCGEEIESTDRHEFRACSCGAVMVDGGLSYRRRVFHSGATYTDTSVFTSWEEVWENHEDWESARLVSRTLLTGGND